MIEHLKFDRNNELLYAVDPSKVRVWRFSNKNEMEIIQTHLLEIIKDW